MENTERRAVACGADRPSSISSSAIKPCLQAWVAARVRCPAGGARPVHARPEGCLSSEPGAEGIGDCLVELNALGRLEWRQVSQNLFFELLQFGQFLEIVRNSSLHLPPPR